jgi:hypothetical protein
MNLTHGVEYGLGSRRHYGLFEIGLMFTVKYLLRGVNCTNESHLLSVINFAVVEII